MIRKVYLFHVILLTVNAMDFGSDSSSCEDDGGGNGNGGNNNGCPRGWRRFTRSSGGWCMRVFAGANIEYTAAASACANNNAVLSGIQDANEMKYLTRTASSNLASSTGSLWIGAKRTSACAHSKLTTTCSKTTSFYWTDGSTTGTAGFSWLDQSQPDNALGGNQGCIAFFFAPSNTRIATVNWFPGAMDDVKGNQDCIAFFFAPSNTRIATVNWFPGAMDDVNCDSSQFNSIPQRRIQGYVCGKDATS